MQCLDSLAMCATMINHHYFAVSGLKGSCLLITGDR